MQGIKLDTREKFENIQIFLNENVNEAFDDAQELINEIIYNLENFDEMLALIPENNTVHVIKEVQNDLLNSIIFACQGFYRNSYMCLRSAIELFMSFLYYYDHQYEFLLWKSDHIDMTWTRLIDNTKGIFNEKFIHVVSGLNLDTEKLKERVQKLYHEMSQSVHGKYSYMQINISEKISYDADVFSGYHKNVMVMIETFRILTYIRFKRELDVKMDKEELSYLNVALKNEVIVNE